MNKFITLFILLCATSVHAEHAPVVLLSIDGFAEEYIELYKPPTITKLINQGLSSEGLIPVFPSKTFPNHLSIVTGKYPSEHGIIHNTFYRRDTKKTYHLGDGKDDPTWLKAEPIWVTAELNNIKSASYFWPESETDYHHIAPTYRMPYKHSTPNEDRIKQVIKWLSLPEQERPQFITSYFSLVDSAGHNFGPHSDENGKAIAEVDQLLGHFLSELKRLSISVNLVLVSDHGMVDINNQDILPIKNLHLASQLDKVVNGQTQLFIYDEDKNLLEETAKLLMAKSNGHYQVYLNGSYPKHWHLNKSDERIPDLIATTTAPYTFSYKETAGLGGHGFDPKGVSQLAGIFVGFGPDIKPGKVNAFENIYVHSFMMELLDLPKTELSKKNPLMPFVLHKDT